MTGGARDPALEHRLCRLLSAGPAMLEPAATASSLIVRNGKGAIAMTEAQLKALASDGTIVRRAGSIELARAVRSAGPSREATTRPDPCGGAPIPVTINAAESPLAVLVRIKDRNGRPFLSGDEFAAGERLRHDYSRGRIMPRLGANWEARVASRGRGDGGGLADLTDAALAARQRVDAALRAVGPELSGLLVDVCCFLKGLEQVERERGWPVRSAKVVVKTALGALARHYRPPSAAPRPTTVLHWGVEDFRPKIA